MKKNENKEVSVTILQEDIENFGTMYFMLYNLDRSILVENDPKYIYYTIKNQFSIGNISIKDLIEPIKETIIDLTNQFGEKGIEVFFNTINKFSKMTSSQILEEYNRINNI